MELLQDCIALFLVLKLQVLTQGQLVSGLKWSWCIFRNYHKHLPGQTEEDDAKAWSE
jgi:hypothetical protein